MKRSTVTLFFIIAFYLSNAQISNTYQNSGNEYKIVAKSWQTSNAYSHGINMAFSIYKNGKFVHPADMSDGRYVGCRYPYNGPGSKFSIEQITGFGNQKIGWVIKGMYNSCGASYSSQKEIFIFPFKDIYYSFSIDYQGELFETVITDISKEKLSIWYNMYEWGAGRSKSDNYLVPRKINIIKGEYGMGIEKGNLMIGVENIKKTIPKSDTYFVSLFNASIIDYNAKLLEYAYKNYFKKEDFVLYDIYKIPATDEEILRVIQTIKDYNLIQDEFSQEFGKYNFDPPELPRFFNK